MDNTVIVAIAIGVVSVIYSAAGQAGGTAFLAVMGLAAFPSLEMRPTALFLNIVAAGYATWRLNRHDLIDWRFLANLAVSSVVFSFIGGLIAFGQEAYSMITGLLLVVAAVLMIRQRVETRDEQRHRSQWATIGVGAVTGILSGVSGIGGGVFLVPLLITLGWCTPRKAAILSPPFILINSASGLAGALSTGQVLGANAFFFAVAALAGAAIGTTVGLKFMSDGMTRYLLAAILMASGMKLIIGAEAIGGL
ncbi:UNVERIFIED_ORG: sulfite exporter TauE/SafE family protein (plasmid) [Roseateles sp. XES5]|jgi:uncharacterized membrane protein YfcA|uniref:sulfite exporter TauE/SafE family protein n=1 Tax=unclassified Shinella TaxID=2643062 RepID=UPI0006825429|nr:MULTISPECIES: sulfite exporter TauE/SafE family protein [Pseudomonadota]